MHLNIVENDSEGQGDRAESATARELAALASIVDFAIHTAETAKSHEALAYLRNVADIVKADLRKTR